MGTIITGFLAFVSLGLLFVSGGLCLNTAVRVRGIPEYDKNTDLQQAHKWSTIGGVAAIVAGALLLIGTIILFVYTAGLATGSLFFYGLMFLSLAGVIVAGAMAAIAANYIKKSGVSNNIGSYTTSLIAAILAFVGAAIIIVIVLVRIFYKPKEAGTGRYSSSSNTDDIDRQIEKLEAAGLDVDDD